MEECKHPNAEKVGEFCYHILITEEFKCPDCGETWTECNDRYP
jgi:hypothetical protein